MCYVLALRHVLRCFEGVPLLPMAAKICEGIPHAIAMLLRSGHGSFLAEFKYDGFRAQLHMLSDGSVRLRSLFSDPNSGMIHAVRGVVLPWRCVVLPRRCVVLPWRWESERHLGPSY